MPSAVAKTMFVVSALLLASVLTFLYVNARPPAGAQQVTAQFRNAFPLLEGMHVRVGGAVAGSVGTIEVSDEGLAEVTLVLDDSIEPARADASAAIRQQDTTGDSYVDFDPGASGRELERVDGRPTIVCEGGTPYEPCERTMVAPRFDDLLNAFGPSERAGIQLILVELSQALEQRGENLNRAALEIRPALAAANQALSEVGRQNVALRELIADAENVTGQASGRRAELAGLIDSLAETLDTTASRTDGLDAGLERLPETTGQARTTLAALTRTATAARPLAEELRRGAPELAEALRRAPGFLENAAAFAERTRPTLELTRRLAVAGEPTIEADPTRVITGPFDLAPAISNLLTGVLGDDNTIRALFGDDSVTRPPGSLDGFGLGAIAVEPGNQIGYPPEHANRNFLRVAALLNCEMFGVPVEPGCLLNVVNEFRAEARAQARSGEGRARGDGGAERRSRGAEAGAEPASETPGSGDLLGALGIPELADISELGAQIGPEALQELAERLAGSAGPAAGSEPGKDDGPRARRGGRALNDVLDFLLR